MTKALKKAFEAAARLSEAAQDELAAAILAEVDADQRFDPALARSSEKLEHLADDATVEHRTNETKPLDDAG